MEINHRKADKKDLDLYFDWANDIDTRNNSFKSQLIDYQSHTNWFLNKIIDRNALLLVFENEKPIPVGQVRIEKKSNENIIGISIDKNFRGLGLSVPMLNIASQKFFQDFHEKEIHAYIKKKNIASLNSFKKAGFQIKNEIIVGEEISYFLVKSR